MAPSLPIFFFFFFFLLSLLSSSCLARDGQFFSKLPSTTNTNNLLPNNNQPQQDQPDFLPDNENGYGLYGHGSGQFPPSATTALESEQPARKYLPKNYNPVAYVTQPEDIDDSVSLTTEEKTYATNPTNYINGAVAQDFYDPRQKDDESAYRNYPTTTNDNNFYYNGGSRFNSEPQGTRFNGGDKNYFNNGFQAEEVSGDAGFGSRENYFNNNGGGVDGFRPQGMSDTRFLENGKYFYDVNSEKFSTNHPYESLRGARPTNAAASFGSNGEFP